MEGLIRDIREELYCILRYADVKGYKVCEYKTCLIDPNFTSVGEFYMMMKAFVEPHRHVIKDTSRYKDLIGTLVPEKFSVRLRDDADLEDIKKSLVYLLGIYDYMNNNSKPGY